MTSSLFHLAMDQLRFCRVQDLSSTSMPHHPFLGEAVTVITLIVQSTVAAFLLAYAPESRMELLEWTLLPMIGATLAAGGAFCLNTQAEVRKVVIGRCFFALIVGVIGPRLLSLVHPSLASILSDPILKVGAGFAHGFLGYILSWPSAKGFYDRATPIAEQLVKSTEAQLISRISNQVAANVSHVASGVAIELTANPLPETPAHTASVIAQVSQQNIESKPQ